MRKLLSILFVVLLSCSLMSQVRTGNIWGSLFEKSDYAARRMQFIQKISDGIAVIRGATRAPGGFGFDQNNDFFYFTGVAIPDAVLIMDGTRRESLLFFTLTEKEAEGEGIPLELVRKPEEVTGIERILARDSFSSYLFYLSGLSMQPGVFYAKFWPEELGRVSGSGAEFNFLYGAEFNFLQKSMTLEPWDGRLTPELQFVKQLKEKFPQVTIKDCSSLIWNLRKIKSPSEIEAMRIAGQIAVKAHKAVMQSTRPEINERELAALFEYVCKKEGADLAYGIEMLSGKNHEYGRFNGGYDRVLKNGDFLILDGGADYGHYKVDFSTSFPASGKFTPRQKELYELADSVRNLCLRTYRPGITLADVGKKVEEFLVKRGIDLSDPAYLLLKNVAVRWGGYNHPVGMTVHDVMGSMSGPEEVLKPGFVFACDIMIPRPAEEMGIRLEDTVVITKDGCEVLAAGLPRTVEEIKAFMDKAGMIQILKKADRY
jgi:Xaa-Pro aminopeptidase